MLRRCGRSVEPEGGVGAGDAGPRQVRAEGEPTVCLGEPSPGGHGRGRQAGPEASQRALAAELLVDSPCDQTQPPIDDPDGLRALEVAALGAVGDPGLGGLLGQPLARVELRSVEVVGEGAPPPGAVGLGTASPAVIGRRRNGDRLVRLGRRRLDDRGRGRGRDGAGRRGEADRDPQPSPPRHRTASDRDGGVLVAPRSPTSRMAHDLATAAWDGHGTRL